MNPEVKHPKTLVEAVRQFADPEVAWQYVVNLRWPSGVTCPFCQGKKHSFLSTRKTWQCAMCKRQFSVKKGSIFEDSPLPLDKWLIGMWLIANAKNGISSYEIHRSLGITQKSAWFLLHRIRLALQQGTFEKLGGHVEADETYIGGKSEHMHAGKRKRVITSRAPGTGKAIVMGILERGGNVVTFHVNNTRRHALESRIKAHVEPGSSVYTDKHRSYQYLDNWYRHDWVDHVETYVDGLVHTNGLENYWSLLKRTLKGTYVSVEPFHLFRYLDEQAFRFNLRGLTDGQRFTVASSQIAGKRLTYVSLIGKEKPVSAA